MFRLRQDDRQAVQLGIVALTDAPAVNVTISISPLPQLMQKSESCFPLKISVIDRNNPLFIDVTTFYQAEERFGKDVYLKIYYYDLAGNPYTYQTPIEIAGSLSPISIGNDNPTKIVKAIESIQQTLSRLIVSRESVVKPSLLLPKQSDCVFPSIEKLIPELLADMKNDLSKYPFAREFIMLAKGCIYNGDPNNMVLAYYFEDHPYLRNKLRILENHALIYEITYNSTYRFVISEELATYLTGSLPE